MTVGGLQLAPVVYKPVGVRVLAVLMWVGAAVYLGLLTLQGDSADAVRFTPVAAFVALVVYVLFWRPAVRVDDRGVVLINVLRDVRVPFARLDAVDTRYALRLDAGDRQFTAWAAPAPGRTSAMSLTRRDATAAALLGGDLDQGITASSAPNTDSGGAALMVRVRWQHWLERDRLAAARAAVVATRAAEGPGERVTVVWNVPVAVAGALLLVLSGVAVLA